MSYRPEKSTSEVISEVRFPTFAAGMFGEYNGITTESPAMAVFEKKNVALANTKDKLTIVIACYVLRACMSPNLGKRHAAASPRQLPRQR